MVNVTFLARFKRVAVPRSEVGTRRIGMFGLVGLVLSVAACASILGNDYEVDQADAAIGTASTGASGSSGTAGAGGSSASGGASGAAGAGGGTGQGGASGSGSAGDAGSDPDASNDSSMASDASVTDTSSDTSLDSTASEAAPDGLTGSEAAADTASADAAGDAGPDGSTCNPLNGSCAGGLLTCSPGFSTCNGSNSDGCECATSGCCGSSCETQHVACMVNGNPNAPCTDGTGQHFYDCVALGTINSAQATKACAAVTGNVSACSPGTCPSGPLVVCSFDGAGNCICWEYSGSAAGRMYKSLNPNCLCPVVSSPTWN